MEPIDPPTSICKAYPELEGVRILSADTAMPEGEVGALPALHGNMKGGIFDGGPIVKTFWKPDVEEIEALLDGGIIEIDYFTFGIPPTAMFVHRKDVL